MEQLKRENAALLRQNQGMKRQILGLHRELRVFRLVIMSLVCVCTTVARC